MTADGCLVCSGPLHDTWLGAALAFLVPAMIYLGIGYALVWSEAKREARYYADRGWDGHPLDAEDVLVLLLLWPVIAAARSVRDLAQLTNSRATAHVKAQPSRRALEQRIADLERELDVRDDTPAFHRGDR